MYTLYGPLHTTSPWDDHHVKEAQRSDELYRYVLPKNHHEGFIFLDLLGLVH